MMTRRGFIRAATFMAGGHLTGLARANPAQAPWYMPDESHPHAQTWMAFGASRDIWGNQLLPRVRKDLAMIARTIAQFEPVSMLVRRSEHNLARKMLGPKIDLHICPLDDLWMRDTGPTFVINRDGEKAAADLNFNGWGEKQPYPRDAQVAAFVAQTADVPALHTDLVLEGGCIEVDGQGTAIITESCVLNDNRNPGISKAAFERQLKPLLGLDKIIWLPGIKGMDITDGHTDFYARFAKPGVVLAGYDPDPQSFDHKTTTENLRILKSAKDARGRLLQIRTLQAPATIRRAFESDDFAAGYIGYYVCNSAVIMQQFGDRHADGAAAQTLREVFPNREVVALNVDGIAAGGGSVHCATQQEPAVLRKY